jgi:hypothetical protein
LHGPVDQLEEDGPVTCSGDQPLDQFAFAARRRRVCGEDLRQVSNGDRVLAGCLGDQPGVQCGSAAAAQILSDAETGEPGTAEHIVKPNLVRERVTRGFDDGPLDVAVTFVDGGGHRGNPSPRSATMLRWISFVPA